MFSSFGNREPSIGGQQCRRENTISAAGNWGPLSGDPSRVSTCNGQPIGTYELDYFQYKHPSHPSGAVYTQHGILRTSPPGPTVRDPLAVYQQRPFLMPEVFNSGCAALYCNGNGNVYPTGRPACNGRQTSSYDNKHFDPYFASIDPFEGNSVPTSVVCYKGVSPNSTAGWIFVAPASGPSDQLVPMWTLNTK